MKNCSFFLLVCALVGRLLAAETIDPWRIDSGPIDPKNYFGETVGNGMIGLLSAPAPFGTQQVLVNGAYEAIGWSGVSALVPSFDFLKLSFLIDGERIDRLEQVMNFRQTLDLKKATFTTSFEVQDKATVSYSVRALRQLPFAGLLEVSIEAKRPIVITPMSLLAAPGNLTE